MGGRRVVALTPQGRQLDQALVEELAGEEELTLLSARFEGFDERIVEHVATDAVSIGPYVLSGGELPAMVLVDAIAPASARRAARGERRPSRASPRRSRAASSSRTTPGPPSFAAGASRTCSSPETTRASRTGGARTEPARRIGSG